MTRSQTGRPILLLLGPLALMLSTSLLACGHAALERRIVALEREADRQAVIRLIHQYAHAIDGHDDALLARTFALDSVAEYHGVNFPMDVRLNNFEEIRAWLKDQVGSRDGAVPWHYMDTHLVEVDGNRATLKTYQHNRNLSGVGLYTIDAVRTSVGWRIAKLRLEERLLDPELIERMKKAPASPGAKPEASVDAAERRFLTAISGDVDALEDILAPDFLYSTAVGTTIDKRALIAHLRSGKTKVGALRREDVRTTASEGLVVTTGSLVGEVRSSDRATPLRSRYLHVWVPTPDGWRLLARQASAPTENPS